MNYTKGKSKRFGYHLTYGSTNWILKPTRNSCTVSKFIIAGRGQKSHERRIDNQGRRLKEAINASNIREGE
jgi:hypothetical protein